MIHHKEIFPKLNRFYIEIFQDTPKIKTFFGYAAFTMIQCIAMFVFARTHKLRPSSCYDFQISETQMTPNSKVINVRYYLKDQRFMATTT